MQSLSAGTVARDYAALCCEEFGLTDLDKNDVLKVSQVGDNRQTPVLLLIIYSR
jgi:hypothetical protein